MTRGPARRAAMFVVLGLASLLAACGDDGPRVGVLSVELVSVPGDGEPPGGWSLRSEKGSPLPLNKTDRRGDHGRVFEARGTAGRYTLLGPDPWSLVGGPTPVAMSPDLTPVALGVGKKYSIYLVAGEREVVGAVVARRPGTAASGGKIVEFSRGDSSTMSERTVLRFTPTDWRGSLRVLACIGESRFAFPMSIDLPPDGTCTGAPLVDGQTLPVVVSIVPAPASQTPVDAEVQWEGIVAKQRATTDASGHALFAEFPTTGDFVRFRVGAATWSPPFSDGSRGDLRFARPAGPSSGTVVLAVAGRLDRPPEVQARAQGSPSYGLVSDVRGEADGAPGRLGLSIAADAGRHRFIVVDGESGTVTEPVDVRAGESVPLAVTLAPLCRVAITVEGGVPKGRRYALECRRVEDGEEVLAQGFVDRVVARSDLEMWIPTGVYHLALSDGARTGPRVDLTLQEAGTRAAVRLEPPR